MNANAKAASSCAAVMCLRAMLLGPIRDQGASPVAASADYHGSRRRSRGKIR